MFNELSHRFPVIVEYWSKQHTSLLFNALVHDEPPNSRLRYLVPGYKDIILSKA